MNTNERIEKLEAENELLKKKLNQLIEAFNAHGHEIESSSTYTYTEGIYVRQLGRFRWTAVNTID